MQKSTQAVTATERTRVNFGKIPEAMELPNLISVQKQSFTRFMDEGLREAFRESSPIQSQNHVLEVTFGEHQFGDPAHSVEECREKDMTYQAPLLTDVRLTNKETGEIKEQLVFMGDFPMMTDQGTFIINGTERIVVSQLVRSPGVYYSADVDGGKDVYTVESADVAFLDGAALPALVNEFANIVAINGVDELTVDLDGVQATFAIDRSGEEDAVTRDGAAVDAAAFKDAFQQVNVVPVNGFAEEADVAEAAAALTLRYAFSDGTEMTVEYLDFSINNYALRKDGSVCVTVSKDDCAAMLQALRDLLA